MGLWRWYCGGGGAQHIRFQQAWSWVVGVGAVSRVSRVVGVGVVQGYGGVVGDGYGGMLGEGWVLDGGGGVQTGGGHIDIRASPALAFMP